MSRLFLGSIDVTKIDKSKLYVGKKGTYLDVQVWINDEVDQYGQIGSISTGKRDEKIYLGNVKEFEVKPHDLTPAHDEAEEDATGGLPF